MTLQAAIDVLDALGITPAITIMAVSAVAIGIFMFFLKRI